MDGMIDFAYLGCGILLTSIGMAIIVWIILAIIQFILEAYYDRKYEKQQKEVIKEMERILCVKRPRMRDFYSKELLNMANEPPSEEAKAKFRNNLEEYLKQMERSKKE